MNRLTGEAWLTSSAKRRQDIGLSLAMSPLSVPALLLAAAAIRTVDNMPPLFVHERVGQHNKNFTIFKLRTMPPETALTSGGKHNDERRTNLGKFLARTRTDEAPQFLNILRGEMSVVGYRPLMAAEYERAKQQGLLTADQYEDFMRMRYVAKPGLLHLMGVQNPHMQFGSAKESWQARYDSEREYFDKASLQYDWKIMLDSVKVAADLLVQKVAPSHDIA